MKGKNILLACLALAMTGPSLAQGIGLTNDGFMGECRSLFAAGRYRQVEQMIARQGTQVPQSEELDYIKAVSAANVDLPRSGDLLASFMVKYPNSVYGNKILSMLGQYFLSEHDYESALESFDRCDMMKLSPIERSRSELNHAIALLRNGDMEEGLQMLKAVDRSNLKADDPDMLFFDAFANYINGDYAAAREGFKSCLDGAHSDEARLYLSQIENEKKNYKALEALNLEDLTRGTDNAVSLEAKRIFGTYLLEQGDAERAADMLSVFVMKADSLAQPDDLYQLGMAYFLNSDWKKAISYFAPASEGDSELSQSAAIHMGLAALNSDDAVLARLSFQRASGMNGRDDLRQQALINYAQTLIEWPGTGFDSPISVLETLINDYPESPYADRASVLLAEELECSTDYDAALASIAGIRNPDNRILKAKQNLLYRKGLECFSTGLYEQAVKMFAESEKAGNFGGSAIADLPFWSAESYYRMDNMKQARQEYLRYLGKNVSQVSKYTDMANYGLGYIAFNQENYSQALQYLKRSLSVSNNFPDEMKSDVMLRSGDCYLNLKDYDNALEEYRRSIATTDTGADYALNQSATVYGLLKKYGDKTATLERLVKNYPNSQYVPQALYEIGHTYQQTGSPDKAIGYFDQMIEMYPASDLARRAAVETALIHYQNDNYDEAIRMYKKVINDYPGSNEARTAMSDLRSIYVEKGDVNTFIEYTQNTGGVPSMAVSQRDSLSYAAAESMFSRGDTKAAMRLFQDYLSQYPTGAFRADALYYTGVIYEKDNDYDKALDAFLKVAGRENSRFATNALSNAASMAYSAGDWETAMDSYIRLQKKSSDPVVRQTCAVRIVSAAGQAGDNSTVLDFYRQALDSKLSAQDETDIRYYAAKAMLATGNKETRSMLEALSKETRSLHGAEGNYLLSQYLYDKGEKQAAQDNIMVLVNGGTPHIYWLARSFILLSDILKEQGKDVEARQYLLSLKSNYSENDDIARMIEERLK